MSYTEMGRLDFEHNYEAVIAADRNFAAFRSMPIVNQLSLQEAMQMFSCMNERRFACGETIYEAGTASSQEMYMIIKGKASASDRSGYKYDLLTAGDVFGLFSFLDEDRLHSATLKAEDELVVLSIDRAYFDLITLEDPALGYQLLKFMFRLLSKMALKQEHEYAAMHGYAFGRSHYGH